LIAVGIVLFVIFRRWAPHEGSAWEGDAPREKEFEERFQVQTNELKESQRRLASLISSLPGMVYRCRNDRAWTMEILSDGSVEMTGYSPASFLEGEIHLGDLIHPEDREEIWSQVQAALEKGAPFTLIYRLTCKDGREKWVSERGHGVYSESGEVVALEGFVTDITEHKRAELERKHLDTQIQQSQRMESLGLLAGGIAHDFNNLLQSILGFADLAKMEAPEGGPVANSLDHVLTCANRAADLVRQILAFSRQNEGDPIPTDLHLVAKESAKLLRASLPASIEIREDIDATAGKVIATPTQLHQVIMNLCTNAAHALRETGGVLGISLAGVQLEEPLRDAQPQVSPGAYLRLRVSDTGPGIPHEIQDRIFEPFFTTKGIGEGTGLGLAVVHGIVTSCGGGVRIESRPHCGTIFEVFLPKAKVATPEPEPETVSPRPGKERILFVDDAEEIVEVAVRSLGAQGYAMTGKTDASEALELFLRAPHQFDAVISDITMPRMRGDAFARALLSVRPDLPIILITGYSEVVTAETAKQLGVKEYLSKPVEPQVLAQTLRKVLDDSANVIRLGVSSNRPKPKGARHTQMRN
jgi:PAS domain S-box-containing protein